MPTFEELREPWEKKGQADRFDRKVDELVKVVCRQTDYDEEKAKAKLVEHALDLQAVVREYMGVGVKRTEEKKSSTNQMVYKEFRTFLDDAATSYYKRKEAEQIRNKILEERAQALQAKQTLKQED
jgi:uncharacterized DUF497 family protein